MATHNGFGPNTQTALKDSFYAIAETMTRDEIGQFFVAQWTMNDLGMACSPDHYDKVLRSKTVSAKNTIWAGRWVGWLDSIIAAVDANEGSAHDIRGMWKNTHIVIK